MQLSTKFNVFFTANILPMYQVKTSDPAPSRCAMCLTPVGLDKNLLSVPLRKLNVCVYYIMSVCLNCSTLHYNKPLFQNKMRHFYNHCQVRRFCIWCQSTISNIFNFLFALFLRAYFLQFWVHYVFISQFVRQPPLPVNQEVQILSSTILIGHHLKLINRSFIEQSEHICQRLLSFLFLCHPAFLIIDIKLVMLWMPIYIVIQPASTWQQLVAAINSLSGLGFSWCSAWYKVTVLLDKECNNPQLLQF